MAFTFFFRDSQTLELLAQCALPTLKQNRYIRVWDAGCATGPEPYSIAILFRENMGHFLFRNVQIYATDIDESNFESIITRGVYSEQELGRIPREIFAKYFQSDGVPGYFQICAELRQAVRFCRHDLVSLQAIREDFGLVVCKNVLLHLAAEQRVKVIKMFHRALVVGGYLVMEQTQKLPSELSPLFHQVTEAAQLYQKVA